MSHDAPAGRPFLERVEALLETEAVERKVTLARLAWALNPGRATLDLFARLCRPENGRLVGELLERMAHADPEYLVASLDRWAREASPETRDHLTAECNRPAVYDALCDEAERLLADGGRADELARADAALTHFAGERMLYALIRHLYKPGSDTPQPFFERHLAAFDAAKAVALIDREKECGDGRFLFNAILWLKARGDKPRVARLVEIFSKLDYGVEAKEAAAKIGREVLTTPREAGKKLVVVVSPSQSITNLVDRALEGRIAVEQCAFEEPGKIAEHLVARQADLAIVDRQHAGRLGVAVAMKLRALRPDIPLVFAFDTLAEMEKADLFRAGVHNFVTIPFALEEMRHTVGETLERADRERVTRKAQLSLEAGAHVFREGDAGDCCFIVKSGKVKIWRLDGAGREIHLVTLGGGEIFGEMALIDKSPRSASATAVERVELLRIEEANFEKVIQSNPGFALKMITILVKRLRGVTDRLKELESKEGADR